MIKTDVILPYKYNTDILKDAIVSRLPVRRADICDILIIRRELVLKEGKEPQYKTSLAFSAGECESGLLKIRNKVSKYDETLFKPKRAELDFRPVVVGAGPSGLFAALTLSEAGARPIVLERGLRVEERRNKIAIFEKLGVLDTECNVQFGEGGAGTYSDGKLKVGSRDEYKMKVLTEFVSSGADESILYSNTAHLGTDRLPMIIEGIRNKIISLGGEFLFSSRFTGMSFKNGRLVSVKYEQDGCKFEIETDAVILATGHSARDTIYMLRDLGIPMTAKGFGIGVRLEHPREYINKLIYKDSADVIEETASYHLVTHLQNGRSVYSFCMCPGGSVVAAASEEHGIVTNGMSEYSRMNGNSNAAILVSVTPGDFASPDPLAGIELQRVIERSAYSLTGGYRAPAECLGELMNREMTENFRSVKPSYPRGTEMHTASEYLPEFIVDSLRLGIADFDAWLNGYYYSDAVITGPETRTTSPVRIERGSDGTVPGFDGVYPAGEGAGYAGGIVSSAVDGIRAAEKIIEKYNKM